MGSWVRYRQDLDLGTCGVYGLMHDRTEQLSHPCLGANIDLVEIKIYG